MGAQAGKSLTQFGRTVEGFKELRTGSSLTSMCLLHSGTAQRDPM
jgi:hypothetical protein